MSGRDRLRDRYPLGAGAAAGCLAWVTGAIVTYVAVLYVLEPPDETGQTTDPSSGFGNIGDNIGQELAQSLAQIPFEGSGMIFYNAHIVPTEIDVVIISESLNFIDILGGPWTGLYVLPPVALTVAGAAILRRTPVADARAAAASGATVTAGYLPMVAIGTQLYTISISVSSGFSASISIGPSIAMAIVVAGFLYPLVFGAIGGIVGWKTWGTRAVPRDRPGPAGFEDGTPPGRDRASRDGYGAYGSTDRDRPPRGTASDARDARRERSTDGATGRPGKGGRTTGHGKDPASDHQPGDDGAESDVFGDVQEEDFDDWETPDSNSRDEDTGRR